MNARLRALLLGAALATTLGAAPPQDMPASAVLQRYADALATSARAANAIFEFSLEQVGLHDLSETHRVYRSGLRERDETLTRDGVTVKVPFVHVAVNRPDPYDVLAVAPKPAEYAFTFAGRRVVNGRAVYAFRTSQLVPAPFSVTDVLIDAARFLPSVIAFQTGTATAHGKGRLTYGPVQRYWVVREVAVGAKASGKDARERIVWSKYRFPAALPASTFSEPRVIAPPAR